MSVEQDFAAFLARVRAGDEQAAAELVRNYGPVIRREVRFRLSDPALYRLTDDEDVCQSVLASFFVRAALGEYDLADPAQLLRLLLGMARNKLAFQARKQRAQRRDGRRLAAEGVEELDPPGGGATPSRHAAGRELLLRVRQRLSEEERQVADLRSQGHGWVEIARALGGSPDWRRVQLTRALDRVSRELGLEGQDDG
jgi:RNA polymerase sigma-70 factor (ECF subfamily)